MDPDAPAWEMDEISEDTTSDIAIESSTPSSAAGSVARLPTIPTGPPVPNPYAHVLDIPCKKRIYTHWARPLRLRYSYLQQYRLNYYKDYIDYMDKRIRGLSRDVPTPQEWAERSLRIYTGDGQKLSRDDYKYWLTSKNIVKPKCSIFHAVHSKGYINRQYKELLC